MADTLESINADMAQRPELRPVLAAWAKAQHIKAYRALAQGLTGGDSPQVVEPLADFTLAVKRFRGQPLRPAIATGDMVRQYVSPAAIRIGPNGRVAIIASPTPEGAKKIGLYVSTFRQYVTGKQKRFLRALAESVGHQWSPQLGQAIDHPGRDFTELSAVEANKATDAAMYVTLRSWGFA